MDIPYRYTAQTLDQDTQLYYYGAPYYDPRTSVWESPDSILGQYVNGTPSGGVYNPPNLAVYSYGYQNPPAPRGSEWAESRGRRVWGRSGDPRRRLGGAHTTRGRCGYLLAHLERRRVMNLVVPMTRMLQRQQYRQSKRTLLVVRRQETYFPRQSKMPSARRTRSQRACTAAEKERQPRSIMRSRERGVVTQHWTMHSLLARIAMHRKAREISLSIRRRAIAAHGRPHIGRDARAHEISGWGIRGRSPIADLA